MKIGVTEIVVIFIVALIVLGPDKLPLYAKKFGAALREFRKASSELTKDIQEEVIQPLADIKEPLEKTAVPFNEMARDIKNDLNSVASSINDIGKSAPGSATTPGSQDTAGEMTAQV